MARKTYQCQATITSPPQRQLEFPIGNASRVGGSRSAGVTIEMIEVSPLPGLARSVRHCSWGLRRQATRRGPVGAMVADNDMGKYTVVRPKIGGNL